MFTKNLQKIWNLTNKWEFKETLPLELQASHLYYHPQCPTIHVARHEYLNRTWKNQTLISGEIRFLLLQNPLTASKHPHNSLPSCHSMLLVQISVFKHLDEDCNESKPLSQLHNCPDFLLRLRLLSFFKGALLLGFKKSPSLSFWSRSSAPRNIFSIVYTNSRACLDVLNLLRSVVPFHII